ncbi:MAG: (2Fe-2S) ferredoxin domain-containing protein [Synergistaceae bacterium]|nr:(2Fe-2S) ferredoxin domain-containing protein [Synergistaceae bacterium]
MAKIGSLDDLRKIKESAAGLIAARGEHETCIVVGLGTCGIAAGARDVMKAFVEELEKRSILNVTVESAGCAGMCQNEPVVDVVRKGEPRVTYGKVKQADAGRIIADHIVNGKVVQDLLIG